MAPHWRRHAEAGEHFLQLPAGAMRTFLRHIARPALKMFKLFTAGPALIFINRHSPSTSINSNGSIRRPASTPGDYFTASQELNFTDC